MDAKKFKKIQDELARLEKPEDKVTIEANGMKITGILEEKLAKRTTLDDGIDTDIYPTELRIKTVNDEMLDIDVRNIQEISVQIV